MRKMISLNILRGLLYVFVPLCLGLKGNAQCVDIDKARYPITINGVETSPGVFQDKSFAWNNIWNFNSIKQRRVSGLDIGGTDLFHGFLEYLPASYNLPANSTKKYPVILYFHGGGSKGDGSAAQLCRLFKDMKSDLNTHLSIPGRVERNTSLFTQTYGAESVEYIVISPQFSNYDRINVPPPIKFPTAQHVEDVINYVEANYRIDPRRIYLTGFSNGANMISEYAASSLARAKRIAAIMPVALCSDLTHSDNTSRGYDAKYIGQAKLKTWFVYCQGDNCGISPDINISKQWVNAIKAVPGHVPPRFTVLRNINPASLYNCSDTLLHDAWSRAYNPDFVASFTNDGTSASSNDGINQNIYKWFAESLNATLPVELQSFTARLAGAKVEIKWVTTDEKNNASFSIERAGADQQFKVIATIPGAGDHTGEKEYNYTDHSPLPSLSYYRLVQTDIDGKKTYFDIKRVLNNDGSQASVMVSPNPFVSDLTAFISLDRSQKVFITLTDMTGKILITSNGIYGQGSSEVKLSTAALHKGVYLLKVSGERFNSTQKVMRK